MNFVSRKPYYASITIIVLPLLVFCSNKFLGFLIGREIVAEIPIDIIFHILGGMSIALSTAGVLWHLMQLEIVRVQDTLVFRLLIFGCVCFVVISWEIYEFIVVYPTSPQFVGYIDTIKDMTVGLVGGLFALILIRMPTRQTKRIDT